ncbi:MAG TPA: zf-HC2 domain-containing protein [bacterium]|nr:zf-HC2 domain-containing protein [bacterium]
MDCRQVHQAYSVYLQKKLPPVQMEWISNHIQECPDCQLLDQKVRQLFLQEAMGGSAGTGRS